MKTVTNIRTEKILPIAVTILTLFGWCGLAASIEYETEFDWTLVYDADELPGNPGAIQYSDGTSDAFTELLNPENLNMELRNGLLGIDSTAVGRLIIDAGQDSRFLLNSDSGYTAEFRARLIETRNTTDTPDELQAAALQLNDGRSGEEHTVHLGLFTWPPESGRNWAQLRGGARTPAIPIGDDFNIYTVTVAGGEVTLYFNGAEVATVPTWNVVERPQVWLGDLGAGGHTGHFEVDSLRIYDGGAVAPKDAEPYEFPEPYWIQPWEEPKPGIVGLAHQDDEFNLSFETLIGGSYRVESRDDPGGERNEPPVSIIGDGGVVTATDEVAGIDRRFYQVVREVEEIVYEEEFDWDFRYEGDVDPLSEDAIQYGNGTTGPFVLGHDDVTGKYRVEDGLLMFDILLPRGTFEVPTDQSRFFIDEAVGYTVEYRARARHSDHYGAANLQINSGWMTHIALLGFETLELEFDENGETVTREVNIVRLTSDGHTQITEYPVGQGFNTYTMIGDEDRITVFINGVEVGTTENIQTGVARNFLWMGSATGADRTSRYDVDYLRIYTGGAVRPVSPVSD